MAIDPSKPADGEPMDKGVVRANFAAIAAITDGMPDSRTDFDGRPLVVGPDFRWTIGTAQQGPDIDMFLGHLGGHTPLGMGDLTASAVTLIGSGDGNHAGKLLISNDASDQVITLPAVAGFHTTIWHIGAGALSFAFPTGMANIHPLTHVRSIGSGAFIGVHVYSATKGRISGETAP
jgi:hypothetical protein